MNQRVDDNLYLPTAVKRDDDSAHSVERSLGSRILWGFLVFFWYLPLFTSLLFWIGSLDTQYFGFWLSSRVGSLPRLEEIVSVWIAVLIDLIACVYIFSCRRNSGMLVLVAWEICGIFLVLRSIHM
jgi:hypothetical protein